MKFNLAARRLVKICIIAMSALLGGCLTNNSAEPATVIAGTNPSNNAPNINGVPPQIIRVGVIYSFIPAASDPDGDAISFTIVNRPGWATFDPVTGRLFGTPQAGDVGLYSNIQITVSDASASALLSPFSIDVTQVSLGSVILSWTPPTANTDGSNLDDLAGYRIYYGISQGNYPNTIVVNNPGLSSYVVENLSPGTYFFVGGSSTENGGLGEMTISNGGRVRSDGLGIGSGNGGLWPNIVD